MVFITVVYTYPFSRFAPFKGKVAASPFWNLSPLFTERCGDFAGATRRLESAAWGFGWRFPLEGFQMGHLCMLFIWDQVSLALFVRFWGLWIEYIFLDGKNFLVDFDMSKRNIMKHPNPMSLSQNFERHH